VFHPAPLLHLNSPDEAQFRYIGVDLLAILPIAFAIKLAASGRQLQAGSPFGFAQDRLCTLQTLNPGTGCRMDRNLNYAHKSAWQNCSNPNISASFKIINGALSVNSG